VIGVAAIAATLIAEALTFYVVNELLAASWDQTSGGSVRAVTYIFIVIAAFGLPRILDSLAIEGTRGYAILGTVSTVLLYALFRIEFAGDIALWNWSWVGDFVTDAEAATEDAGHVVFGAVLIIAAWARGAWRSTSEFELEFVPRYLAIPFAVVIVAVLLAGWSDRIDLVGRGAGAFFVCAVFALALSQLALSGASIGNVKAGEVTTLLLLGTAAVTVVGVIVFGLLFGILGDELGAGIGFVVTLVLTILLTPIAYLFEFIFGFLLSGADSGGELMPPQEIVPGGEPAEPNDPSGFAEALLIAFRIGALLLVLGVIAGVIAFVTRLRRQRRERAAAGPEVTSSGSLGGDLRSLLGGMFRRDGASESFRGSGIHALYHSVLEDARKGGRVRAEAETPTEFAPALHSLFHTNTTDDITKAFEQARYAGRPPAPEELADLEHRWNESRFPQGGKA
jgi:hypothetical protein